MFLKERKFNIAEFAGLGQDFGRDLDFPKVVNKGGDLDSVNVVFRK